MCLWWRKLRQVVIRLFKILLVAISIANAAVVARSQTTECRDEWPGHLVRSVKIKARWLPDIPLPLKKGDELTPDKLRDTRLAVIAAINDERNKFETEFIRLGRLQLVDVSLVRACARRVAAATCQAEGLTDKCVDVEVTPRALSTNPIFMGATLLPIPRANTYTFLSGVPRLLRIFDPKFGVGADGEIGPMPDFEMSTDLLAIREVAQGKPAKNRRAALLFNARGAKSTSEPYYTSEAKLSFVLKQPTEKIQSLGVEASYSADHDPQLSSRYLRNFIRIAGHTAFNPALGVVNRVALTGGYRRSSNRLSGPVPLLTTENSYELTAILDGRIFNGFTRGGFWIDGGKPEDLPDSYHRIAGLIGYEKELVVGDQTIGIEALFGAGKASEHAPEYGLFYGGNTLSDFIYQDITDREMLTLLPSGPVLRSFGRNQAGFRLPTGQTRGANTYQHLNLSIAIPISSLSKPLIPDEVVNQNPRLTLRDLVQFAVNSGQDALASSYTDEGLDDDEAEAKAKKVFDEIRPGVNYLTNYAKIYSIKPLVMLDAARMTRTDINDAQYRYSVGGGLQLTIVVAKFQAGYMHAIQRFNGEKRGNFVFRLVFTNLF